MISSIESLIARGNAEFAPYWGWHDDHRAADGTDAYLPAMQQVRSEFYDLVGVLLGGSTRSCLQLGAGPCNAPHAVWRCLFNSVVTIDFRATMVNRERYPGMDTGSTEAVGLALDRCPYDFLLIDADHTFDGVKRDYMFYSSMVRPGGVIAFHDALPRAAYPEVEVWRFVDSLATVATVIGDEVGVAWVRA